MSDGRRAGGVALATYNVHGCVGADGRFSPPRILGVIERLGADVIALQEVDSRTVHGDGYAALRDGAGMHAVEGPLLNDGDGDYGNLLLSRWAPREVRRIDLSVAGREPRGALDVDLDTPCGTLRVVVTHLGLRIGERRAQLQALRAVLASRTAPVTVVMGDLNVAHWRGPDLFGRHAPGLGAAPRTFPARLPLLALDRMQASSPAALRDVRAHRCELSREASDHLPLVGLLDARSWRPADQEVGGRL